MSQESSSSAAVPTNNNHHQTTTSSNGIIGDVSSPSPSSLLIPKQETQAWEFQQRTSNRGRGVRIGILDTGIDPAANNRWQFLSSSSTGDNDNNTTRTIPSSCCKLIDIVDCTGSGDVALSEELVHLKEKSDDGKYWLVLGLTGRILHIPVDWNIQPWPKNSNEDSNDDKDDDHQDDDDDKKKEQHDDDNNSNSQHATKTTTTNTAEESTSPPPPPAVRLGWKAAYELFPRPLVQRVRQERKTRLEESLASHVVATREQIATLEMKYKKDQSTDNNNKKTTTTLAQQREYDDYRHRLKILNLDHDDPGPVYDCVVFPTTINGGGTNTTTTATTTVTTTTQFRAAIDTDETGIMDKSLAPFGVDREYGTFGTIDQLNYGVQIYNHGTLLSIVCDSSPHGTHVASIASDADHGVAPDATLVSFKIGEPRLGTMETGPSLIRALHQAVQYKCDIINLSYGEGVKLPNMGHFVRVANDLVWKHNIVFVAAAGNQGPALTTVDAPGGTTTACIGVAAYVSPAMRDLVHSSLPATPDDPYPETTYTWSSTGPCADGSVGVSVSAPGGAICAVPNWCLQKSRLMNGTSMAAPHATGCIALLISACKAEGIPVTPNSIRRALERTAKPVDHLSPLQQGWGMVQVEAAWDYLQTHRLSLDDVHCQIEIVNRSGKPRGIYVRQPHETAAVQNFSVKVDPQFRREVNVSEETQQQRIHWEVQCTLQCSEKWVRAPDHVVVTHNGRAFEVQVDPTNLAPGLHSAQIQGMELNHPDRKALFSVPVTIVKPIVPVQPYLDLGKLEFAPAEIKRIFVVPPKGSTWIDVRLRDLRDPSADGANQVIALHSVQLLPHAAFRDNECSKRMSIMPGQTLVQSIAVTQGVTCEVTFAKFWSTRGLTQLEASIHFRGIRPEPEKITMYAGGGGSMVRIHSDLQNESVSPTAKFTKWQCPLRPNSDFLIAPLKNERDCLPTTDKKSFQLVLTYEFEQEEKGSFVPRAPALQDVLYESAFESQCMLIFDGDKKFLGISDAYPSTITAPKGPVVIRLEVRHEDPSKLEKLKDLVIWIERNLSKEISISAFSTKEDLMLGNDANTFKKRTLRRDCSASVFFSEPPPSKFPSGCSVGCQLVGTVSYGSGEASLPGSNKKPGGFTVRFVVGPKPSKELTFEAESPEPSEKQTAEQKLADAVRTLKIEHLGKLTKEDDDFLKFYAKLETEYPDHLPLKMEKLRYLDKHEKRSEKLSEIIAVADSIVQSISEDELAKNLGLKVDPEDGNAAKERDDIKEQRSLLVEALVRMAHAYADMDADGSTTTTTTNFDDTLKRLTAWADIDSFTKYAHLYIVRETRAGRYGTALIQINKLLNKENGKGKESNGTKNNNIIKPLSRSVLLDKRAELYEKLDYSVLLDYDKKQRLIACPKQYTPF